MFYPYYTVILHMDTACLWQHDCIPQDTETIKVTVFAADDNNSVNFVRQAKHM